MTPLEWRPAALPEGVRVEDVADSSPGIVVAGGSRDGRGWAARLGDGGQVWELDVPEDVATQGAVRMVRDSDDGTLGVCGATGLWGHGTGALAPPPDEAGRAPARLWVTSADGTLQVTAAYPADGGQELRVLDADTLALLPVRVPLTTDAPLTDVHVAAFAGRVTVATRLGHAVWWAAGAAPDPEEYAPDPLPWASSAWGEAPLRITGGADGSGMSFFAGVTAEGRPGLWDGTGELRETVDLTVTRDADVLVAGIEPWGGEGIFAEPEGLATFAVPTAGGNVLAHEGRQWSLPDGALRRVVLNRGFARARCFALVGDDLLVAELPG